MTLQVSVAFTETSHAPASTCSKSLFCAYRLFPLKRLVESRSSLTPFRVSWEGPPLENGINIHWVTRKKSVNQMRCFGLDLKRIMAPWCHTGPPQNIHWVTRKKSVIQNRWFNLNVKRITAPWCHTGPPQKIGGKAAWRAHKARQFMFKWNGQNISRCSASSLSIIFQVASLSNLNWTNIFSWISGTRATLSILS